MPPLRQLLRAALAASLLFSFGSAEARFGKRSAPRSEQKKSQDKVHDATPVGSDDEDDDEDEDSSSGSSYVGHSSSVVVVAGYDPTPTYAYSQPMAERRVVRPRPVLVRMGVEGQSLGGGAAALLNLGLEGHRWGVSGMVTALALPTDDGSEGSDKLQLSAAHLTYALYSSDRGRLRAEAGLATAHAPDVTFVGPSMALSFERCLFGALDLEGRGQFVPVPHLQLDAQAGLALHLGVVSVRGGWRWLLLDDRGHVDGEVHRDILTGPYLGVGLNF